MAQQVRAVVALAQGKPVSVETIVVPDPGPGDVVVTVRACGVCHTDLHYREGGIGAFAEKTLVAAGQCTKVNSAVFDTIIDSIRGRLLALPEDTHVRTGHGDGTTIATEAPHLEEWIARRH